MEMVRGGVFLVLVVGLGAGSGCSGSKPSPPPLSCTRSVAEFCSNTTALICSLTWDDVEAGRLMCVSGGVDYA